MATLSLASRDFGPCARETMVRPWSHWYHQVPAPSEQASHSTLRQIQDEQGGPRCDTRSQDSASCPSPRDSSQSSHVSSPTSLEWHSPSCSTTFAEPPYSPGASQRSFYNYQQCPSTQPSSVFSSRPDFTVPRIIRAQPLPAEFTHTTDQNAFPERPRPPNTVSIQPSIPGPSRQILTTQPVSPPDNQTEDAWQDPRAAMTVSSLLNRGSPPASPAKSLSESKGKSRCNPVRYELSLRQQPVNARSCGFGDRDRRVIDPPPILQLKIHAPHLPLEVTSEMLSSTLNVVHCSIWSADGTEDLSGMPEEYTRQKRLMGSLVASPFFGEDEHGEMGSFFCFPDISCRTPGKFRLKFSLITINPLLRVRAPVKTELLSDVFQTYTAKEFPGMLESSALAKALRAQGCNIPTKKGIEKSGKREESDLNSDDEPPQRKRPRGTQ